MLTILWIYMFCKKCGSILQPKTIDGKKLNSCSCGYTSEENIVMTHKGKIFKDVEVVHKEEPNPNDVTEEECPKCHNKKAYFWTKNVEASDEPDVIIFRCTKCSFGWREGRW